MNGTSYAGGHRRETGIVVVRDQNGMRGSASIRPNKPQPTTIRGVPLRYAPGPKSWDALVHPVTGAQPEEDTSAAIGSRSLHQADERPRTLADRMECLIAPLVTPDPFWRERLIPPESTALGAACRLSSLVVTRFFLAGVVGSGVIGVVGGAGLARPHRPAGLVPQALVAFEPLRIDVEAPAFLPRRGQVGGKLLRRTSRASSSNKTAANGAPSDGIEGLGALSASSEDTALGHVDALEGHF